MRLPVVFIAGSIAASLAWSADDGLVARYGFDDAKNLGRDGIGKRNMVCAGGRRTQGPAGPGVVFDGRGGMELPAAQCPAFRSGFGLDLWLRFDDLTGPMLVAGRDGQFLLRLDPLRENGRLSLFVRGKSWEPRLRGPRPLKGQWYHVRAGWNGRQMVLQLGESVARQRRRVRMRPSKAPFVLGKGMKWAASLKGAFADVRVCAPPPASWFAPAAEEKLAGARVAVFGADNAYPRAGRPESVTLRLQADTKAAGGKVALAAPASVRLLDMNTRTAPALAPYQSTTLAWRVQAAAPGTYTVTLADAAGGSLKRSVVFHRPVAQRALPYVPGPKPVQTEVLVGAQMCPLWKEGTRRQVWEPIIPWPNRKPALGWYDEGDPAVTDWEIKWCLDHGISFFMYCWYRANQGGPVEQRLGHAIHEGLFRSRYRDQFKFAIMWTNAQQGREGVASEQDFLRNLLPFWIDNYFKHPSYLVVDGKPVLFIYRPENLVNDLGSTAKVRAAIDKARAACRAAGFKGLTLLGEYRGDSRKRLQLLADLGMDYSFAYCWPLPGSPSSGKAVTMQEAMWRERRELNVMPDVTTVSMGWDSRPWHPSSSIWRLTPADFEDACRRALAATRAWPKGSLARRIVLLDNWNEFGEGHYIAPHRQYGFGYLDAARRAFAAQAPHEHVDLTPADVGLGPYDSLYQSARRKEERVRRLVAATPKHAVKAEGLVACWTFDNAGDAEVAVDMSGHGLGARLRGAKFAPGKRGLALVCDGGCAQAGPDPRLFPEQLTVSCWVRIDRPKQTNGWFLNCIYGGATDCGYRLGLVGNGRLCWGVPETEWSHHLRTKRPLPIGRWVHVAATADSKAMRIYVDGREVARTARTVPVGAPIGHPLTLGNYAYLHPAHFVGLLDEVRLYDRVLTPSQIRDGL